VNRAARVPRGKRGHVVLFDGSGRAFDATASVGAWKGSREARRSRSWVVSDASINALLAGDVQEIRRRSRDLVRNNAWAQSAFDSYVANSVGSGIVPRINTDDDDLRRDLLEAWEDFVDGCDADGQLDFYGIQALVARSFKEGGDCFVRLRPRRREDRLPVPLQLQVLEAEYCDPAFEQLLPNGGRIQAGIELDPLGRRAAYHMWRSHPGEMMSFRDATRLAVPADQVLHIYDVRRPGQLRGVPDLAPVLAKLWELDRYDDAEVVRKQVAAMFAGFITTPTGDENPLEGGDVEGLDDDETPLARLEPGTMQELGPGQEVTFSSPSESGQSYEPFTRTQLRQAAGATGATYEQTSLDLSGVNFSSIRAGLIEFYKKLEQKRRNTLIFQLCRPVWRRFLETVFLSGRIAIPSDPRELRALVRVSWTPTPGREYVDPEKEVRATLAKLRAGLISRSEAVAEEGFEAEALDREIAADNARADRLGLRFDGDARIPPPGSAPMPVAPIGPRVPPPPPPRQVDEGGDDDDKDETEGEEGAE
jgi:lambda family phage portal protein